MMFNQCLVRYLRLEAKIEILRMIKYFIFSLSTSANADPTVLNNSKRRAIAVTALITL